MIHCEYKTFRSIFVLRVFNPLHLHSAILVLYDLSSPLTENTRTAPRALLPSPDSESVAPATQQVPARRHTLRRSVWRK